jgi:hypothetical protein
MSELSKKKRAVLRSDGERIFAVIPDALTAASKSDGLNM